MAGAVTEDEKRGFSTKRLGEISLSASSLKDLLCPPAKPSDMPLPNADEHTFNTKVINHAGGLALLGAVTSGGRIDVSASGPFEPEFGIQMVRENDRLKKEEQGRKDKKKEKKEAAAKEKGEIAKMHGKLGVNAASAASGDTPEKRLAAAKIDGRPLVNKHFEGMISLKAVSIAYSSGGTGSQGHWTTTDKRKKVLELYAAELAGTTTFTVYPVALQSEVHARPLHAPPPRPLGEHSPPPPEQARQRRARTPRRRAHRRRARRRRVRMRRVCQRRHPQHRPFTRRRWWTWTQEKLWNGHVHRACHTGFSR